LIWGNHKGTKDTKKSKRKLPALLKCREFWGSGAKTIVGEFTHKANGADEALRDEKLIYKEIRWNF